MTTPAKNVNITRSVSDTWVDTTIYPASSDHTPQVRTSALFVNYQEKDIRPASGNSPMSNGFRLCRPFSHTGGLLKRDSSDMSYVMKTPVETHKRKFSGGCFWSTGSPPAPSMPGSNLINANLVKTLNKLKEQDLHLGNFLAEGHQVLSMFSGHIGTIARQVRKFRQGNPTAFYDAQRWQQGGLGRHLWCKIPDAWLELQYGWKPLMSDIYGGLHHLVRTARGSQAIVEVRSVNKDQSEIVQPNISGLDGYKSKIVWQNEQKVHSGLKYKIVNPQLAELSSLGLINPLEIVWEVTRFSFIVDWVVPIGPWLSSLTADVGMEFLSGHQSLTSKITFGESSVTAGPISGYTLVEGVVSPPSWTGSMKSFSRTCFASTPVPGVYVKNPLSFVHAANAIALLVQAFRGGGTYRG